MTVPCSLLSLVRSTFRRGTGESLLLSQSHPTWASHLAAGHVSDTLVKRGPSAAVTPRPTVMPPAS